MYISTLCIVFLFFSYGTNHWVIFSDMSLDFKHYAISRYRQFHKTFPRSGTFVYRISVRFYETGCTLGFGWNNLLQFYQCRFERDVKTKIFLFPIHTRRELIVRRENHCLAFYGKDPNLERAIHEIVFLFFILFKTSFLKSLWTRFNTYLASGSHKWQNCLFLVAGPLWGVQQNYIFSRRIFQKSLNPF